MYTLWEANIIDVEVDRSDLIVAIEAPIEARLKSDILVFFSIIIYGRWKHRCSYDTRHRGKLNWTQGSSEYEIFDMLKNSVVFVRFPRKLLFAALLFLLFFRSSAASLSRLGTVRNNIAEYRILDLLGRGIVIAGRRSAQSCRDTNRCDKLLPSIED